MSRAAFSPSFTGHSRALRAAASVLWRGYGDMSPSASARAVRPNETPRARSGATTQKMTRDEIVEFIHSVGQVKYEEKLCPDFKYPEDFDQESFKYFLAAGYEGSSFKPG